MKITVRNCINYRRVRYADDNGNLIGEIDMYGYGNAFANCQVAYIANIEELLDLDDSDFILKVLRKLCLGYVNIGVIDIDKEIDNKTYTPKLQKETQNVISDLIRYNIIDEEPKEREKMLYNYIILGKNDFDVAKKDKEFYDFFESQKMSIEVERYSDFYNIRYIAVKIINIIEDYINNDEFDGDIYSIMKDYWQNYRDTLGNYLHSKTFDGVFKLVNKWYEKYK
jgi:hypothetical protein